MFFLVWLPRPAVVRLPQLLGAVTAHQALDHCRLLRAKSVGDAVLGCTRFQGHDCIAGLAVPVTVDSDIACHR